MPLTSITLCGADDTVDVAELAAISKQYPVAEWGILYQGEAAAGYPSLEWIEKFLELELNCSLHLCGPAVFGFIDGVQDVLALARRFKRIQINVVTQVDKAALQAAVANHPAPVILPYNDNVGALTSSIIAPNKVVIFDGSGGTGKLATVWPAPVLNVPCIYAGGLGPDNIAVQLPLILAAAQNQAVGIDMESRLRGENGHFSPKRALTVLQIATALANQ